MSATLPANHPRLKEIVKLREYVSKDKPKVLRKDFKFEQPLESGWMLPYLFRLEDLSWGRWDHWARTLNNGALLDEPIPRIEWSSTYDHGAPGFKMLERCLNSVTNYGDWQGWSGWQYFEYFLDWALFGLGYTKEEPKATHECEGASERLYQLFNLEPLLAYPNDYLGQILAENNFGRRSGFFPTPMDVCEMMVRMQMTGEDCRTKTVCDPALGTGRMILCASNHSYRLYGQDINGTVIKACLFNGYLYAPWLVRPFDFLELHESALPEAPAIPHVTTNTAQLELIPA